MKNLLFGKCFLVMLLPIVVLSSCTSKPNKQGEYVVKPNDLSKEVRIKYQDNGDIDYLQEYANNNPEGFFINLTKGKLKSLSTLKDGKNNGCGMVFHSNGSLNNFGQYNNGVKTGWFYVFDKNGNLSNKREYLTVEGKEYLNQWVDYKTDGSIEKKTSNYISVQPVKDTIMQDEEYKLNISLEAAFFKQYMVMAIGGYDENFNLPKGAKCDTIRSINFVATYKTKTYNRGKNVIRGMVLDLQPDVKDPKKINVRKIYFSHEFLVR
jgi:antitoxin component YwqK of YwqJK toxin-antitoxin module